MIKSVLITSAITLLLAVSAISYSRPFSQERSRWGAQSTKQEPAKSEGSEETAVGKQVSVSRPREVSAKPLETDPQTYVATAYSLRGRTASGQYVSRGLIAADPRVLPLGTRVRIDAGSLSGEYLVADTGGAVKGRHVDIWTPTSREAMQFGKRSVKLTVLSYGGVRRAARTKLSVANALGKRR